MVLRVVIIGAGAAGLAALRRFTARECDFQVVCFQELSIVGGLWNYCDNISDLNHPTGSKYTAVYKSMRTNFPKQAMAFPDFPFPNHLPSFLDHADVKDYLEAFSNKFDLRKYIKFNKRVVSVTPKTVVAGDDTWKVKVADVHTKLEEEYEFDAVVVCNGHYTKPFYSKIKGLNEYQGQVIHSQCFKDPEEFRDKRVLVIGGGPSGIDIVYDVNQFASKTWLSHRYSKKLPLEDGIEQIGEILQFTANSVVVHKIFTKDDGYISGVEMFGQGSKGSADHHPDMSILKVNNETCLLEDANDAIDQTIGPIDVVIFCTGFSFSIPFLCADSGVTVSSPEFIEPLYKDLVSVSKPTLSMIGLLSAIVPFPIFDCQAQFLVALLLGKISMPSNKKDLEEEMKQYNAMKAAHGVNLSKRPFHVPIFQWYYVKHLAQIGNFEPPPDHVEDLYRKVRKLRLMDCINYKNKEFKLGDHGLYEIMEDV